MNKFYVRKEDSEGFLSFYWGGVKSNPFSEYEIFLFDDLELAKDACERFSFADEKSLYLVFSLDGKLVE